MNIKYVMLSVDDIDQQIAFLNKMDYTYKGTVHLKNGITGHIMQPPVSMTGFVLIKAAEHQQIATIVLDSDNCLKDYHELKTKGVQFSAKPYYLPAGLAADFEDNNGNHFLMIEERNYEEED
jgi:predicted enzyme related to lactoylglutathione lyase